MHTKGRPFWVRTDSVRDVLRANLTDWCPNIVMAPRWSSLGVHLWLIDLDAVLSFTILVCCRLTDFVRALINWAYSQWPLVVGTDDLACLRSDVHCIFVCFLALRWPFSLDSKNSRRRPLVTYFIFTLWRFSSRHRYRVKWLLNPTNGARKMMVNLGFRDCHFNW